MGSAAGETSKNHIILKSLKALDRHWRVLSMFTASPDVSAGAWPCLSGVVPRQAALAPPRSLLEMQTPSSSTPTY